MISSEKMMRLFSVLIVIGLLAASCSAITGSEEDEGEGDGDQDTETAELTVSADPSEGGSVDPESGTFDVGSEVEVTATPADGWEFAQWTGDLESEENPLTFTIEEDTELTAEFTEVDEEPEPTTYDLTVNADPSEGGSVEPESGTYDEGEQVEVTATANDGWEFAGWSGDVDSDENPLTVTMDSSITITADFSEVEPTTYELTVNTEPTEGGSVDPSSGTFDEGEEVEVTATASDGWSFTGWTGDIESDDNPLTVTMDGDTEITANFEENAKAYSNEIEVSDGTNSEVLTFGMDAEATAGFDDGLDEEAPPAPPQGSFYGNFVIEGYNLFADYRPVTTDQTVWELNFAGEDGNSVTLSWDFSSSDHTGSLTLVDDPDNPSLEIDMEAETSHEVTDTSVNTLYIIQE